MFFTLVSLSFEGGLFQAKWITGLVWQGGQTHLKHNTFPLIPDFHAEESRKHC